MVYNAAQLPKKSTWIFYTGTLISNLNRHWRRMHTSGCQRAVVRNYLKMLNDFSIRSSIISQPVVGILPGVTPVRRDKLVRLLHRLGRTNYFCTGVPAYDA